MSVTSVLLPDVVEWVRATFQQNKSPWERSLMVKDFAYRATANPITIQPFGAQTIDGLATATINNDGDCVELFPLEDLTGWWLFKSGAGVAGTTASAIQFIIFNPAPGVVGDVGVPWNCTITSVTMMADQVGSIVVDLWNDSYANYPPTVADTIVASAPPTISSADHSQDGVLTGWSKVLAAGSTIRLNVVSVTTITRCNVWLEVLKA